MLKKDNFFLGVVIGLILPAAVFGFMSLLGLFTEPGTIWARPFEKGNMMIFSIIMNVFPLRIYFVKYKAEKTGKGILAITFVLMAIFFLFIRFS